jgi:Leucine-rich repeat (LRR) protein
MAVGWGQCIEGEEVELWGFCFTITLTSYLNLSGYELSGEIPSEIGNLTYLSVIDLGSNQLSGEIPSEIGNLNNLTILDLGGNQLSGEIPSEIFTLTNLTQLELGGNQFSGEIPSEIGNLMNLIWLNLVHNKLSGIIPSNICTLNMDWSNTNNFSIYENEFCPPYPECIVEYIGYQDTLECIECPDNIEGDFNFDGLVNVIDILILVDMILTNGYDTCNDMNLDESINVIDILIVIDIILDN